MSLEVSLYGKKDWAFPAQGAFDHARTVIQPALMKLVASQQVIYPRGEHMYQAFRDVGYSEVKVVILGQDPYHNGLAIGRAFDVALTSPVPPSLKNVVKEVLEDYYEYKPEEGALMPNILSEFIERSKGPDHKDNSYLEHWARQGVLLLNTALTVEEAKPESHIEMWAPFTKSIIAVLQKHAYIVWVFWGKKAQHYHKYITNNRHVVIEGAHPSPLAGSKFKGGKYFTKVNDALIRKNFSPIIW